MYYSQIYLSIYICACLCYYKNHTEIINIHSERCLAGNLQTLHLSLLGMYSPLHQEAQFPDHTDESLWSVTNSEAISSGMSWNCPKEICLGWFS